MRSRLRCYVIHFLNLLMLSLSFDSIHGIALKIILSTTEVEIHHAIESLYSFYVVEVHNLSMESKKIKHGCFLVAKPN